MTIVGTERAAAREALERLETVRIRQVQVEQDHRERAALDGGERLGEARHARDLELTGLALQVLLDEPRVAGVVLDEEDVDAFGVHGGWRGLVSIATTAPLTDRCAVSSGQIYAAEERPQDQALEWEALQRSLGR